MALELVVTVTVLSLLYGGGIAGCEPVRHSTRGGPSSGKTIVELIPVVVAAGAAELWPSRAASQSVQPSVLELPDSVVVEHSGRSPPFMPAAGAYALRPLRRLWNCALERRWMTKTQMNKNSPIPNPPPIQVALFQE